MASRIEPPSIDKTPGWARTEIGSNVVQWQKDNVRIVYCAAGHGGTAYGKGYFSQRPFMATRLDIANGAILTPTGQLKVFATFMEASRALVGVSERPSAP